jgi:DNA-directed RNA polymerase specialized sigma24 family protein
MSHPSAGWELDGRALRGLLARLDGNPSVAGEKYEQLRRGLVKMFDWRGAAMPEACADETIDRVARKLDSGTAIDDVVKFAHGVARLVLLERQRRPEAREIGVEHAFEQAPAMVDREDPRLACLERCLEALDAPARELIVKYYVDARGDRIRGRAAMATSLGLTQNALRSRAQRIRDRLERCTAACAERQRSMGSHDL